jgi:hypothetical protein
MLLTGCRQSAKLMCEKPHILVLHCAEIITKITAYAAMHHKPKASQIADMLCGYNANSKLARKLLIQGSACYGGIE